MFIAGDFGVIWDWTGESKKDLYGLNFLSQKPWTTIVVTGNHENYDVIETMPQVDVFGGVARQCIYMDHAFNNIFIVDEPTIFDIENQHILCLPKADSHDIWNLLDPKDANFKEKLRECRRCGVWYRIVGKSWWPQEKINVEETMDFLEPHENEHFDLVISHEAPAQINQWFSSGFGRRKSNEGQRYYDVLRQTLDFDSWIHGHFHFDGAWPQGGVTFTGMEYSGYDNRMYGIFTDILQLTE